MSDIRNPNIFLKLDGVNGDAKADGYKDQIVVTSWNWAVDNSAGPSTVQGGNTSVTGIRITMPHGRATAALMEKCSQGKTSKSMNGTMTICRTGAKLEKYIVIKLTAVLVSHVGLSGSEGRDAMEDNVTLNFTKFEYEYQTVDPSGTKGAKPTFTYDITAATSSGG